MFRTLLRKLSGGYSERHLQYSSLEEWAEKENVASGFGFLKDPLLSKQYVELKAHLWEQHFKSLSTELQIAHTEGRHPSQSHGFTEAAEPYRKQLAEKLDCVAYVDKVQLGYYHGDQIILQVLLNKPVDWQVWQKDIPRLFQGFQVKVGYVVPSPSGSPFECVASLKRQ